VSLPTSHLTLILLAALSLFLIAALLLLSRAVRRSATRTAPPHIPAHRPIPVREWYLAALAVLLQVAIVFLLVWAVVFRELADGASPALTVLAFFATALCLCWLYAWRHGAFDPDPPAHRSG